MKTYTNPTQDKMVKREQWKSSISYAEFEFEPQWSLPEWDALPFIDWIELRWRRNVNEYVKKAVDGKPTYSFLQIFLNKPGFNHTLAQVDVFPYDYIKDYDGRDINKEYYDTKMIFYRDIANGLSLEEVV